MTLLAIIIMAAAAASGDDGGIVASGTVTVGASIVTGILTYLATKRHSDKVSKSVSQAVPQPCLTEQTGYQAAMKANEKDHADLFNRMRIVEAELAGIKATITAKFDGLSAQLMETREMVRSLYDKVCNGKRK